MAEVAPLVGASIVNITRVVDGAWIEHVADTERPEWLGRTSRRPFSDRVPSTDAARTGKPVVFHTHADREAAYQGASWLGELADFGPVARSPPWSAAMRSAPWPWSSLRGSCSRARTWTFWALSATRSAKPSSGCASSRNTTPMPVICARTSIESRPSNE